MGAREHFKAKAPTTTGERLKTAVKDRVHGTKRCACGCGRTATAFRGGKLYHKSCVGPGSGWDKSVVPKDRTPPRFYGGRRWVPNDR